MAVARAASRRCAYSCSHDLLVFGGFLIREGRLELGKSKAPRSVVGGQSG